MVPPPANFLRITVLLLAVLITGAAAAPAKHPAPADFHATVQPLLVQYCYDCHGDGARKGNVAFDRFKSDADLVSQPDLWFKVLKNVRAGLMPNDDGPRPTGEEIGRLERWIKYQAFGLDPADPDPGRTTIRRLNRVEYRNTIHDLMGIDFNSEVEFPPDDTGHGFDNLGEVLTVSPLLLEKYLAAAEEVVDQAVPRVAKVPANFAARARDFRREGAAETPPPAENPDGDPEGKGGGELNSRRAGRLTHTFTLPQAGSYKFAFEANVRSSFDFDTSRATLVLFVDGEERQRQEIAWGSKNPRYEIEQPWTAGEHHVTLELQPLPDAVKTPQIEVASAAIVPAPAGPTASADPAAPVTTPASAAAPAAALPAGAPPVFKRPPPDRSVKVRVASAQFTGPMDKAAHWVAPANYTRFFPREQPPAALAERDAYAREILRKFATRAFRRPVEDAMVAQLVAIAHGVYTEPGARFEDGIARAMMGVLASPRFIFRLDAPATGQTAARFVAVDEYALATRLSYFLWSSMPDEELFALAQRGALRRELPAQVARMLKDEKAHALVRNFSGQWLQARDIETVPINARVVLGFGNARSNVSSKADLDGPMRKAMRGETEMVFDYVLRENRSVLEFIDADYTFVNAKLAAHYGLPEVKGDELRRVMLPPGNPRGGFLTEATVLAVTSNPTRTSPVKRGLFVLDNFLGTPPPAPPPNIPALEESAKGTDGHELPLREALAIHRSDKLCASCHARMDPLGFALENFNALGMWRDQDAKQPINPAGQLVTGESFADIRELKRVLTHERHLDYYRCLTEKMLTYAIGRGLDYHDVETVDEIVSRLDQDQGRFSTLLNGIIASAPFQKQRNPAASRTAQVSSPPAPSFATSP